MSLLILSIDLQRIYYFIAFMIKWWMGKWCNGEIKNKTGNLFSHKY